MRCALRSGQWLFLIDLEYLPVLPTVAELWNVSKTVTLRVPRYVLQSSRGWSPGFIPGAT